MSPRRGQRRTGGARRGLFDFAGPGGVRADDLDADAARARYCDPARGGCGAQPHEPCTAPSRRRGGRRPITGHHQARATPPDRPQETPDA